MEGTAGGVGLWGAALAAQVQEKGWPSAERHKQVALQRGIVYAAFIEIADRVVDFDETYQRTD